RTIPEGLRTMRAASGLLVALAILLATSAASAQPSAKPSPPKTEADGKIATEIERRLSQDPHVNATAVHLDVRGGVVTLGGRVPSDEVQRRAEAIAASVRGVRRVHNRLVVGNAVGTGVQDVPGPIPERVPGHE